MTRGFATIKPECEEVFDAVKETDKLNYVIYEASAHDKTISVAQSGKYQDYTEILSHFKGDTPRYAVINFKYDSPTGDAPRHKLVFITWVPEGASIHDKAYYTTNKDHLYRALEDISLHVLAANQTELAHAAVLGKFKVL
ncbi:Actin-binding cofilin/tropomyosin type [Penicillium canariense]|uniref:Cofilin n=1 Tax=Penicillium canariense TaxID=189055 RepID=A0A9W9IG94_9EURO|nr:Actin-binding cofilin/tropomyosin type [Penicillium canariense]KAJ5175375.1 Actin-binding cofilin/tropomyosin type [Penicillium canariense]